MIRSIRPRIPDCGIASVLVFAALGFASSASAQQPKPSAVAAEKRAANPLAQRLKDAQLALQKQEYSNALALFRQVDAIESTLASRLGIAECLRQLGKLTEAYDAYDQLLRERGTSMTRPQFERVEQALSALRASTAVLTVQVSESGAKVALDNAEIGAGPLDRAWRRMPGRALLSVTKQGFQPWSQELELRAGEERKVTAALVAEKTTGNLLIRTNSTEPAELWLDGKDVGPLPFSGEVEVGEHAIIARAAAGESSERKVVVSASSRAEVELAIVLRPAQLRVLPLDASAVIQIDGRPVGSGRFEGELAPGNHVVVVEKQGFESKLTQLNLEPGERVVLDNVSLVPLQRPGAGNKPDYAGIYGRIALTGLIGRPTNSIATACPVTDTGGSCKSWPTAGAEIDARIGYSFGLLALEAFTLLGSTFSSAQMTIPADLSQQESAWYGIARNENFLFVNPIVAGGLAARVSGSTQGLRLGTSWGGGIAWHQGQIGRTLDASAVATQDTILRKDAVATWQGGESRVLPLLTWDADVEFGATPGTRLLVGLHCQLELGSAPSVAVGSGTLGTNLADGSRLPVGGGNVQVWGSPTFLIGPKIGLAIGH
jgi:hypothetical protein